MSSTAQTAEGSVAVVGGRVVTPKAVIHGGVRAEGDRIVEVGDVDADADTVLIAGTAMALGPGQGFVYAVIGSLLSAASGYGVGWLAGRRAVFRLPTGGLSALRRILDRRGVTAVLTVRLVPVAPFTVINLAAGALGLPFRHYMAGTVLGMVPGIAVLTLVGDRLRAVVEDPSVGQVVALGAAVVLWLGLGLALDRWLSRRRQRREARRGQS